MKSISGFIQVSADTYDGFKWLSIHSIVSWLYDSSAGRAYFELIDGREYSVKADSQDEVIEHLRNAASRITFSAEGYL